MFFSTLNDGKIKVNTNDYCYDKNQKVTTTSNRGKVFLIGKYLILNFEKAVDVLTVCSIRGQFVQDIDKLIPKTILTQPIKATYVARLF